MLACSAVFVQHFSAGDIGRHQVGCELDTLEPEVHYFRESADEQRLRKSRHAGQQRVAAREHRRQDLVDHLVLAHDALRELLLHLGAFRVQHFDALHVSLVEFSVHFPVSSPFSLTSTVSSRW